MTATPRASSPARSYLQMDVAREVGLRDDGLEPHGALLLPDAQLPDHVPNNPRSARLLAIACIRADWPVEFLVALFIHTFASNSPGGESGVAVP